MMERFSSANQRKGESAEEKEGSTGKITAEAGDHLSLSPD